VVGGEQGPAIQEDAVSLTEYRLQLLREDLKLTSVQQPLWDAYADKVSALAADISRERVRLRATLQMNGLQRIDQSVDVARNRLTALEDIASAAKALYVGMRPNNSRSPTPGSRRPCRRTRRQVLAARRRQEQDCGLRNPRNRDRAGPVSVRPPHAVRLLAGLFEGVGVPQRENGC